MPSYDAAVAVEACPLHSVSRQASEAHHPSFFLFVLTANDLGVRQDEGSRVRPLVRGDVFPAVPTAAGATAPIAAAAARRSWAVRPSQWMPSSSRPDGAS